MIVNLNSFVDRIIFNEEEIEYEPNIQTIESNSSVGKIYTDFKAILPESHLRETRSFVSGVSVKQTTSAYNVPILYFAHLNYVENKTNIYFIE